MINLFKTTNFKAHLESPQKHVEEVQGLSLKFAVARRHQRFPGGSGGVWTLWWSTAYMTSNDCKQSTLDTTIFDKFNIR